MSNTKYWYEDLDSKDTLEDSAVAARDVQNVNQNSSTFAGSYDSHLVQFGSDTDDEYEEIDVDEMKPDEVEKTSQSVPVEVKEPVTEKLPRISGAPEYKSGVSTPVSDLDMFVDKDSNQASSAQKKEHRGIASFAGGLFGGMVASAAVVGALLGTQILGPGARIVKDEQTTHQAQSVTVSSPAPIVPAENQTVDEAVAAKCLPSVVSVSVSAQSGSGTGSGVILDKEGHIITNWHVAGDAEMITVGIGEDSYPATLVGGDESSDIAVIQIDADGLDLTPIEVGDSSALVVGDWVMTLGSPLGLDQSASSGIVSALYRNTAMQSSSGVNTLYTNLIQVDAAINGGNSGGALVNDSGQLVGINTLYANGSGSESFAGIGFAIPGNYAVEIANKVIAGEKITHAYMGASCATVNAQNSEINQLSISYGAYVAEIEEDSPAAKGGLKVGDVITKIGDTTVRSADDYILAVRVCNVGDEVDVVVRRGDEDVTLKVTLGSDEALQEKQKAEREKMQHMMQQNTDLGTEEWPFNDTTDMREFLELFEQVR